MPLLAGRSLSSRFVQLAFLAAVLLGFVWLLAPSFGVQRHLRIPGISSSSAPKKPQPDHPINHLIRRADKEHADLIKRQAINIKYAAQNYRELRGRQPPPGFDVWYEFARNKSAIIVEEFFDQIYHDINPFWGMPAKEIREQAHDYKHRIVVRNHNVTFETDIPEATRPQWFNLWAEMVATIAEYLPDLDIPINQMDESRMVVPWEDINAYMQKARNGTRIVPEKELETTFQNLTYLDDAPPDKFDFGFSREGPYWPLYVVGCPPNSPGRHAHVETDFTQPPPMDGLYPRGSYEGYVRNWTVAKSPCENPNLQGLHGTFIEPLSLSNTKKFFPLFGGSKLPMNNEILLPAAMYWTEDPFYSGGDDHGEAWRMKQNKMVWRGAASGGRNKEENWARFQRHRFLSMVNGTKAYQAQSETETSPQNFVLPSNGSYDLAVLSPASEPTEIRDWIDSWTDVGFVNLLCFPHKPPPDHRNCYYTDPYFTVMPTMPMSEQYNYKYLPDIDGNSFSGRYRGFLSSTSLPIKATIYSEWHDSRLVPWKHFVPMDNTFIDIYGIMEYFLGNKDLDIEDHDHMARDIALEGKAWAEKVLRKEDMQIYALRLLLEYARLCDDRREMMGWREGTDYGDGVT